MDLKIFGISDVRLDSAQPRCIPNELCGNRSQLLAGQESTGRTPKIHRRFNERVR